MVTYEMLEHIVITENSLDGLGKNKAMYNKVFQPYQIENLYLGLRHPQDYLSSPCF